MISEIVHSPGRFAQAPSAAYPSLFHIILLDEIGVSGEPMPSGPAGSGI